LTKKGRHGWLAAAMFSLAAIAAAPLCAAERSPAPHAGGVDDAALFPPPPLPLIEYDPADHAIDEDATPPDRHPIGPGPIPAAHQLWLLSTRRLPSALRTTGDTNVADLNFEVERYDPRSGWSAASLAELFAADDPRLTTSVLVHGNHTDRQWAVTKGLGVYRALVGSAKAEQPVRLIVWSWPSERIAGSLREDARIKAQRTNVEGYYLAKFLDRLRGPKPVSVVGYSFGARVITGALHLLGGGLLAGQRLGEREQFPRPPLHAVLMAAAIDRDWLLPGRPHGRALSAVDRMVVFVNRQDRVLKWYRFFSPNDAGETLGSHGLPSRSRLGADRRKLVEIDVATAVGSRHGWTNYLGSPAIVKHLQQETLVETRRGASSRAQAGGG
jgi:hypothetical protein